MKFQNILLCFAFILCGSISAFSAPVAKAPVNKILIEKKAHRLTVFSDGKEIRRFKVALGRGGLAKKLKEGDKLTPEGLYFVARRNPKSGYHLSLAISYPNAADIAAAKLAGVKTGGDIMIHGIKAGLGWLGRFHTLTDWTLGCIAVTNSQIEDLWTLAPEGTEVEIRP